VVDGVVDNVQFPVGHTEGEHMKPLEQLDTCRDVCLLAYERIVGA
jgi:hypothetical protein